MFRQIVTPTNNQLTIQLPDELVGHKIEVIAFDIDNKDYHIPENAKRKYTLQELENFYSGFSTDISKIEKWKREDLYDR